jgi:hypothetical protein
MPRHALHGRPWIGVFAVAALIAAHLGLFSLVSTNRVSLGLLALLGVAIAAVKYGIRRRRF